MPSDRLQIQPRGFGLLSRIVYVHQAILLAIFVSGLRGYHAKDIDQLLLPHAFGIVLAIAVIAAMFGVATRKSLRALRWLRLILWVGVIKILVVQVWLHALGQTEFIAYVRTMLLNELVAIPLAAYWSQQAHVSYLASFKQS
jgi:hypothetical protein